MTTARALVDAHMEPVGRATPLHHPFDRWSFKDGPHRGRMDPVVGCDNARTAYTFAIGDQIIEPRKKKSKSAKAPVTTARGKRGRRRWLPRRTAIDVKTPVLPDIKKGTRYFYVQRRGRRVVGWISFPLLGTFSFDTAYEACA